MTSNVIQFGEMVRPTPIDPGQMLRHLQVLHGRGEGLGDVVLAFLSPHEQARQYGIDSDFAGMDGVSEVQALVDAGFGAYVSVNRFRADRSRGRNSRHKKDVSVVSGVVADLDVKPGALADVGEVAALLGAVPAPTMIVDSGSGGAHVYWLFDRPTVEVERAHRLSLGWHVCLERLAGSLVGRQVRIDGMSDMSRVLRLAGSWRHPRAEEGRSVAPVVLRWADGPRWRIEALEALVPADVGELVRRAGPTAGGPGSNGSGGGGGGGGGGRLVAFLEKAVADLAGAPSGHRNTALNRAAYTLGGLGAHGMVDAGVAYEKLVLEACAENGLLGSDGEEQCRATFESGWSSGLEEPLDLARLGAGGLADGADGDLWPSPLRPMDVARRLLWSWSPWIRWWRGDWHRYIPERYRWEPAEDAAVRSAVYKALDAVRYENDRGVVVAWNPTMSRVNQVIDAMAALVHLSQDVDQPSWLEGSGDRIKAVGLRPAAEDLLVVQNGLLHKETRQVFEHDPGLFNRVTTAASYEVGARCDGWVRFLEQLWPDDPDQALLLGEWFGYVLSGAVKAQKCALLVGPPRSGKGTIAAMLTALMGGAGEIAGCSLSSLIGTFGLQPLLGKALCIVGDARVSGDTKPQVEQLLTISGGDVVTVHRKHKPSIETRLSARFMLLSNELPVFADASGALASRFVVMQMTQSFLGREDVDLGDRLMRELPGVLRWSLDGLDRLRGAGWRFTVPASSRQALEDMADASSPVSVFVREMCETGPGQQVEKDVLYAAWRMWSERNGQKALSKIGFGRNLLAAFSQIRRYQPMGDDGIRRNLWWGVGLKALQPIGPAQDLHRI